MAGLAGKASPWCPVTRELAKTLSTIQTTQKIGDRNVPVHISPFDVPQAFRVSLVDAAQRSVLVEFKYLDNEPAERRDLERMVSVYIGKFSGKLLAISVSGVSGVSEHSPNPRAAFVRAESAIHSIHSKSDESRPNVRLNRSAIGTLLRSNEAKVGCPDW